MTGFSLKQLHGRVSKGGHVLKRWWRAIWEPTRPEFRINNFDLLRIFAATQVLIFHTANRFQVPVPGWADPLKLFPGVPIFYVISGYLVSASYERQTSVLTYFKNRFLRIYPGLWVNLGFTVVVLLCFGYRFTHLSNYGWLLAQFLGFFYTPDFLKTFGFGHYNGSLWTIIVELQFYFLLPVLYRTMRGAKSGNRILLTFLFAFMAARLVLNYSHPHMGGAGESPMERLVQYTFVPHFFMFLLGVTLQRYRVYTSSIVAGKGPLWVALYVLSKLLLPDVPLVWVFSDALLAVSIVSAAYTLPRTAERVLRGQDISYGVYIYHGLLINIVIQMKLAPNSSNQLILLVATSACLLGTLSWFFVERPFLRKKRKLEGLPG